MEINIETPKPTPPAPEITAEHVVAVLNGLPTLLAVLLEWRNGHNCGTYGRSKCERCSRTDAAIEAVERALAKIT